MFWCLCAVGICCWARRGRWRRKLAHQHSKQHDYTAYEMPVRPVRCRRLMPRKTYAVLASGEGHRGGWGWKYGVCVCWAWDKNVASKSCMQYSTQYPETRLECCLKPACGSFRVHFLRENVNIYTVEWSTMAQHHQCAVYATELKSENFLHNVLWKMC